MPNGIYPIPEFSFDTTPPARRPAGFITRLRTRLRRRKLDEELASGADPETSVELSLRSAQLTSRASRSRLANALVEQLGDARGPNLGAFRMKTRQQHAAVREAADDLLALVVRLRDDRPIEVQGAAMASILVNDAGSALHRNDSQELEEALRVARGALERVDSASRSLARAA